MVERGFQSDPVKAWKTSIAVEVDANEDDSQTDVASSVSSGSGGPDFQYLLTMPIMAVSKEKKEELLKQRDEKVNILKINCNTGYYLIKGKLLKMKI